MQEVVIEQKSEKDFTINDLPLGDKQRLVDAFVWLIQEDKKQNPALYEINKQTKYD